MSETERHRRRVSLTQLMHLWEFLNKHKEIAVGYNKSTQARQHSKHMWERVANILNSAGEGAIKSGSDWSKYWVDMKSKIKRKNRIINESRRRTGGGPAIEDLSDMEKKFLAILGEDYGSGLPGVQVDPLHEYESNVPGPSNIISQSTGTEEPIYLEVESSEEHQQNALVHIDDPTVYFHHSPMGSPPPDPQPSTSSRGASGQTVRRSLILSDSHETPSPTRRDIIVQERQQNSLHIVDPTVESRETPTVGRLPPEPQPSPSRRGATHTPSPTRRNITQSQQGPMRRRRRVGSRMTATDARERLVSASEKRAEAELTNSRSLAKIANYLGLMNSYNEKIVKTLEEIKNTQIRNMTL